ncbi:MAG: type II toxin-antitoxin system HicA family toxin [Oscillospiraceae bacterium]|nr:type II toxin-antitoxin system HicA family toxin [Oscillospiraceae bacterium]
MKTRDLIKLLLRNGFRLERHGGNHDIYVRNGKREPIVHHTETEEKLAKAIIKRQGLK